MRDRLRGYYPPSPEERSDLWESGLLVLDTNTLLNLYRYSEQTSAEFLEVLRGLSERLWIPYRVALEFQERRLDVIDQQAKAYDAVIAAIQAAQKTVAGEVMHYKKHASLAADELIDAYKKAAEPILQSISAAREKHQLLAPKQPSADPVWDAVTEIFDGRVGSSFTSEELKVIFKEGSSRYEAKIPPGFKDAAKGEPGCFGDLVIWKEILRKAAVVDKSVVFVTDDKKDDWWRIVRGQTIGPRVELVDEFFGATKKRVHFYSPEQFLRFAKERVSTSVSDSSLGEVEKVSLGRASETITSLLVRRADLMENRRAMKLALHRAQHGIEDDDELSRLNALHESKSKKLEECRYRIRELDHLERRLKDETAGLDQADRQRYVPSINQMSRERSQLLSRLVQAQEEVRELEMMVHARRQETAYNWGPPTQRDREQLAEQLAEIDDQLEDIDQAFSDPEIRGE